MKFGILTAFDNYHKYYLRACDELGVDYDVVDIIAPDWLQRVQAKPYDGLLCRPPSKFQERKSMFDERLYFIHHFLGIPLYPSFFELYLYENKRMISYWLDLFGFPKPETFIFYRKDEFLTFIKEYSGFPIVIKSNVGSTSKGVTVVRSRHKASQIANKIFGLMNPKLARGYTSIKTGKILPVTSWGSREKHFVIVQKYEKIKWEWRVSKIGESYFSHKKLLRGDFASGSRLKEYGKAPDELFFLVRDICEKGQFYSMAVDIFETVDGRFLVNELQSLFGQYSKNILYIDGIPGRMVQKDNRFVFEEGEFNRHKSYLLRVQHFMEILRNMREECREN